jgi:hypothetical protein
MPGILNSLTFWDIPLYSFQNIYFLYSESVQIVFPESVCQFSIKNQLIHCGGKKISIKQIVCIWIIIAKDYIGFYGF